MTLNAKQFDTGRIFVFNIMDNDEPFDLSDCSAYLRIAKADGTQFQGHECCTIESSSIVVNTSIGNGDQILTAPGVNKCELHLKGSGGITLTTWTFNIYVEQRVHNGENLSSINSYDVIDNIIDMEKERIGNEQIRKNNESIRIQNEINRIENEEQRTLNETKRQNDTADVINRAETAIINNNGQADYAQQQGDYAKLQGIAANTATTDATNIRNQLIEMRDNGAFKGEKGDPGRDGVITTIDINQLAFEVINGNLIMSYETGNTDANKFSIGSNGHLLYTLA